MDGRSSCDEGVPELGNKHFDITTYDIGPPFLISFMLAEMVRRYGGSFKFEQLSTLDLTFIPPVDLVFIDALHCYAAVWHELSLAARAGARTILLHDTEKHRERGECEMEQWKSVDDKLPSCEESSRELNIP